MSEEIKGLSVSIYRNAEFGDCTNGGVSSKFDKGVITGDGVDCTVFSPKETTPHYVIIKDFPCGCKERIRAVPVDLVDSGRWTMFGGNFLYSSDARFPSDSPIKIHDRVEENTSADWPDIKRTYTSKGNKI